MEHFMTSVFMSIWEGFKLRAFYYVSILFLIRKRGEEEFRTTRACCLPSSTRRSNSGFRSITLLDTVTYKQNQDADTDTQSTFLSLHRVIRQGGRRQKFPSELGHHHLLLLLCSIANSHFCWRVPISIALNSTTVFTCSSFSDSSSCSQLDHFPSICRKSQDIELEPLQEPKQLKGSPAPGNGQIRYRSPSSADLFEYQGNNSPPSHSADQHLLEFESSKMLKRPGRQESFTDKIYRFRGVLIVVSVPLLLITFVLYLMPASTSNQSIQGYALPHRKIPSDQKFSNSYAVIFDAGSSGSRVHVFHFDHNLDLVHIGKDLELFVQIKPGLSAYAQNPQQAANSLISLLDKAESVVPRELRPKTPVRVGATAGLRALEGDASDKILQAVRNLLKERSTLKSEADAVAVLDGTQEGAFQWVTINYLLGNLGKTYSNTVGVVDLGGGSVQMAYAISDTDAAKAPKLPDGEDPYIKEMFLRGRKYYLYVHSYLGYGLLAARAEILKVFEDSHNPCILSGFDGSYKYGGKLYKASAFPSGSSLNECKSIALKALKVNESTCTHMKCTFGGIWNGGGGDGRKNLFVASFFFDRAAEAGFADRNSPVAKVHPVDFEDAAKRACETKLKDAKATYPHVEEGNLPFICMDLVYQYTLLVDGFGLDPWQEITLVKQVKYQDSLVEAAWPLGSAIEAVSSLT